MIYFLIITAVIIGALMPVQAGINAELTRLVQHPYLGALISFFMGTVLLSLIVIVQGIPVSEIKRLTTASPILFVGGFLGALFVGSSIFLIPKLGATTMIAAYITGQLLMSVCMDHYGWFGIPVNHISMTKICGLFMLFVGLFMVMRKVP
ncbi:MAG TPA: DMT family transporter [Bacteriovoracaceae bacterium]|nr:DMT family transporter [Bacteriovoracaceae bacterium]